MQKLRNASKDHEIDFHYNTDWNDTENHNKGVYFGSFLQTIDLIESSIGVVMASKSMVLILLDLYVVILLEFIIA